VQRSPSGFKALPKDTPLPPGQDPHDPFAVEQQQTQCLLGEQVQFSIFKLVTPAVKAFLKASCEGGRLSATGLGATPVPVEVLAAVVNEFFHQAVLPAQFNWWRDCNTRGHASPSKPTCSHKCAIGAKVQGSISAVFLKCAACGRAYF
jgi:hypothetical protein